MNTLPHRDFPHKANVDVAMHLFLKALPAKRPRESELISIRQARGRVLAQRIMSTKYLPPFDIAVVDGYAVHSADLRSASPKKSVHLKLKGESRLGRSCRLKLRRGEAVAVATGSMTPSGTDAVVMIERTRSRGRVIEFRRQVSRWEGMTRRGEDMKPGSPVLRPGSHLRPEDIGTLKALGLGYVRVARRVRVALLSTGSELVHSSSRSTAKIIDLNRPILRGKLEELGADVVDLGIARDDEGSIKRALQEGLTRSELVVVTAGSSVGTRDLVPNCIDSLGKPGMVVHGVAMRPAMPTGLAVVRGKPVVSLPGFPVSAMIAFRVFVRPLVARLAGSVAALEPVVNGVLSERILAVPGYRTFVRVRVEKVGGTYRVTPLKLQRSSMLTSMVKANGIVAVPETVSSIDAGREVSVVVTGDLGS